MATPVLYIKAKRSVSCSSFPLNVNYLWNKARDVCKQNHKQASNKSQLRLIEKSYRNWFELLFLTIKPSNRSQQIFVCTFSHNAFISSWINIVDVSERHFRIMEGMLGTDTSGVRHIPLCTYMYATHNGVSVNDGPHIRRWSHKILIL